MVASCAKVSPPCTHHHCDFDGLRGFVGDWFGVLLDKLEQHDRRLANFIETSSLGPSNTAAQDTGLGSFMESTGPGSCDTEACSSDKYTSSESAPQATNSYVCDKTVGVEDDDRCMPPAKLEPLNDYESGGNCASDEIGPTSTRSMSPLDRAVVIPNRGDFQALNAILTLPKSSTSGGICHISANRTCRNSDNLISKQAPTESVVFGSQIKPEPADISGENSENSPELGGCDRFPNENTDEDYDSLVANLKSDKSDGFESTSDLESRPESLDTFGERLSGDDFDGEIASASLASTNYADSPAASGDSHDDPDIPPADLPLATWSKYMFVDDSCALCGNEFPDRVSACIHLYKHFTCIDDRNVCACGAAFSDRSAAYDHVSTHIPPKRKKCWICGKLFSFRTTLEGHLADQHGDAVQPSATCSAGALADSSNSGRSSAKSIHRPAGRGGQVWDKTKKKARKNGIAILPRQKFSINREDYKTYLTADNRCRICEKCFSSRKAARHHVKVHLLGKTYLCRICHKNFGLRQSLRFHMIRWHPAEFEAQKAVSKAQKEQNLYLQWPMMAEGLGPASEKSWNGDDCQDENCMESMMDDDHRLSASGIVGTELGGDGVRATTSSNGLLIDCHDGSSRPSDPTTFSEVSKTLSPDTSPSASFLDNNSAVCEFDNDFDYDSDLNSYDQSPSPPSNRTSVSEFLKGLGLSLPLLEDDALIKRISQISNNLDTPESNENDDDDDDDDIQIVGEKIIVGSGGNLSANANYSHRNTVSGNSNLKPSDPESLPTAADSSPGNPADKVLSASDMYAQELASMMNEFNAAVVAASNFANIGGGGFSR